MKNHLHKDKMHYEFDGMDMSDWTEEFLDGELMPLMSSAPDDSTLKLKVEKYGDGFEGKLVIHARGTAFVIAEHNEDFISMTKSLKKKMKIKLLKWREAHNYHPPRERLRAG